MNSFSTSQFNYCQLAWVCHSRTMNNKINRLRGRCCITCSEKTSSIQKLLEKDRSVTTPSSAWCGNLCQVQQNRYSLRHNFHIYQILFIKSLRFILAFETHSEAFCRKTSRGRYDMVVSNALNLRSWSAYSVGIYLEDCIFYIFSFHLYKRIFLFLNYYFMYFR